MRTILFLLCLSLVAPVRMAGAGEGLVADSLAVDSLVADFDYLVESLEATHPDPYSGFGGKVFFHKKANEVRNSLRTRPCATTEDFRERAMAFLSNLGDSHTTLSDLSPSREAGRIVPIDLKCVSDGLIVRALPVGHKALLGSRLLGMNGLGMEELLAFVSRHDACENRYDQYYRLALRARTGPFAGPLFAGGTDTVAFDLLTPRQERVTLRLPLVDAPGRGRALAGIASLPDTTTIPGGHLSYGFLDDAGQVMYIRVKTINARDNFEYMYRNGWAFYSQLAYYYRNYMDRELPADTLAAIRELPSFTTVFADMLRAMKARKAPTLIIDLRGNSGGFTPIIQPTLYQLFGDRYLRTDMGTDYYQLISPLYLRKINMSLEAYNERYQTSYALGDYTFGDDERQDGETPVEAARQSFVEGSMSSDKAGLRALGGQPLYTPDHVYVLTDCETFSAAFHYAFYLWKMGATVVGIPSRQAPNTYMEQTPFELPYTRVKGSISNAIQIFLPAGDKRSRIFYPDLIPSYDDYRKYHFDQQSELLFLLDRIKRGEHPSPAGI